MNVLTVKKKRFICEITTYIYEMERQKHLPKLPNLNFGKRSAANFFCLNWGFNTNCKTPK